MEVIGMSPSLSRLQLLQLHRTHKTPPFLPSSSSHLAPPPPPSKFIRTTSTISPSAFFKDQLFPKSGGEEEKEEEASSSSFGEVSRIIGSRTVFPDDSPDATPTTEYLLEWKDGHPPSWAPTSSIAADVLSEYETPWWTAAKKPDPSALSSLLDDDTRDPDLLDADGRTALHFVSGLGCDESIRALASSGADLDIRDRSAGGGLTPLHMAAGYARPAAVGALLQLGADPVVTDGRGRTPLDLTREVLATTPPMQFARRLALEGVVRELEGALYEYAEVEQVLEGRGEGPARREYLVEWKDGGREWVKAAWLAEDLVRDYEGGLEYGVAEAVVGVRAGEDGKREFLVKWVDLGEETWEPEENVDAELVRQYEEEKMKNTTDDNDDALAPVDGGNGCRPMTLEEQQEEKDKAVGSPR